MQNSKQDMISKPATSTTHGTYGSGHCGSLDLRTLARETIADEAVLEDCVKEISSMVKCSQAWWAFKESPEDDVGLLLNPFALNEKRIVLYPFRLTFRMFSQTRPTEQVLQSIQFILGPDFEHKFGYMDTQWECDNVIFVESAIFDANLKVAKGLGADAIPMDARMVTKMCPYKALCANILFSRKLAVAVGSIQTDNIKPFHTYHPQPVEVIEPVVAKALKVTSESVSMIVGRDGPQGLGLNVDYAPDVYFNLFLVDMSWNKKLSALVKAMYLDTAMRKMDGIRTSTQAAHNGLNKSHPVAAA